MAGVLEGGHGLPLFALGAADGDLDVGVAAVRADMHFHHFDGQEARVFGFEPDNLRKLFPDRFRDPQCAPFIHANLPAPLRSRFCDAQSSQSNVQLGQLRAEQADRFLLYGAQNLFGMDAVGGHGHRGDGGALPEVLVIDFGHGHVELVPQTVFSDS